MKIQKLWSLLGGMLVVLPAFMSAPVSAQEEFIEEIIVTVDRREQILQNYSGTAQAFDENELDTLGVGSEFTNLQFVIPGTLISNQEGNVNVTIRGVGSADNTEIIDASVANHLNGIYLARARGIGAMFYDVERVEVNKGPQGTTRGRNAVGGTVNIVTKKPDLEEFDFAFMTEAGTHHLQAYETMVNLPVNDTFGLRVATFTRSHDSHFENAGPRTELEPAGAVDEASARLSALWNPVDRLSIFAMYDYTHEGGTGYPGLNYFNSLVAGYDVEDLDEDALTGIYRGWQGKLDSVHEGFMAQVTYDFDNFFIEYSGSHRDLDFRQTNATNDGVAYPGRVAEILGAGNDIGNFDNYSGQFWITRSDTETHELRVGSENEGFLQWVAGYFKFEENQQAALLSTADNSGCCYSGTEFAMHSVPSESDALYAEATLNFTDELRMTLGVRHTEEEKSREGVGGNYGFYVLGSGSWGAGGLPTRLGTEGFVYDPFNRSDFTAPPTNDLQAVTDFLSDGVTFGVRDNLDDYLAGNCVAEDPANCPLTEVGLNGQTLITQVGSYEDEFDDYRLGFEFDLSEDNLLYLTAVTGHKSGGFNDTFIDGVGNVIANEFEPEKLTMYQLGSKNSFSNFTLNAAIFLYDYQNYVLTQLVSIGQPADPSDPPPTSAQRVNVGTAEITGFELDSAWQINDYFVLGSNILWLDAVFDEAVITDSRQGFGANPNVDLSGNKLPGTSETNINLYLNGVFPLGNGDEIDFTISASSRSEYFLSAFNSKGYDANGNPVPLSQTPNNGVPDQGLGFSDMVDGYTLWNIAAGYSNIDENIRFEAYVNNVTNEIVSTKAIMQPNLNLRFFNNPRTAGVRLKYNF